MNLALIWILSGLLLAALVISLGFQPRIMNKILGFLFLFVGVAGLIFYGYGYFSLGGGSLLTVAKTVFWVFCMFLGRNDIGTISKVPELARDGVQILIYFTHLLALFTTASTVLTNAGAKFIRSLNLLLINHRKLDLIYGVREESLRFAARLRQQEKGVFVFVDNRADASANSRILKMGSILLDDESARVPQPSFLRKIGIRPGGKKITLYCLHEDPNANLRYAERFQEALKKAGIRPEQCRLTILSRDTGSSALQAGEGSDGIFSSVLALDPKDLLARFMIRQYPPCQTMQFDADGCAAENFEALVVGFGRTGQAVLRQLIMNGQFEKSRFHAMVITRDYSDSAGYFFSRYRGLKDQYAIDFLEENARSIEVYSYMEKHCAELNYIVICTGNDRDNSEIAREYADFLQDRGCRALLLQCSDAGVTSFSASDGLPRTEDPYTPGILNGRRLDAMAMLINHQYNLSGNRSAEEDWAACDYFSRMSCRASADYMPAYLKASGLSPETVREKGWPADCPELKENLAKMEHLRWNAFHFCMGYRLMPEELFAERAARFKNGGLKKGEKPGKDTERKYHACLVSWEELKELDEKEEQLAGRKTDYQQMDRENIEMIPTLLKEGSRS